MRGRHGADGVADGFLEGLGRALVENDAERGAEDPFGARDDPLHGLDRLVFDEPGGRVLLGAVDDHVLELGARRPAGAGPEGRQHDAGLGDGEAVGDDVAVAGEAEEGREDARLGRVRELLEADDAGPVVAHLEVSLADDDVVAEERGEGRGVGGVGHVPDDVLGELVALLSGALGEPVGRGGVGRGGAEDLVGERHDLVGGEALGGEADGEEGGQDGPVEAGGFVEDAGVDAVVGGRHEGPAGQLAGLAGERPDPSQAALGEARLERAGAERGAEEVPALVDGGCGEVVVLRAPDEGVEAIGLEGGEDGALLLVGHGRPGSPDRVRAPLAVHDDEELQGGALGENRQRVVRVPRRPVEVGVVEAGFVESRDAIGEGDAAVAVPEQVVGDVLEGEVREERLLADHSRSLSRSAKTCSRFRGGNPSMTAGEKTPEPSRCR